MKDIQKKILYPNAAKDEFWQIACWGAVGVGRIVSSDVVR